MKNLFKKDLHVIILVQIISTILIIGYLQYGSAKPEAKTATDTTTASVNALSARLGQVQVDLNMIKAKLGAGQPSTQNQKR